MSDFSTPQEAFWAGEFGHDYIARNNSEEVVSSNLILFGNIMRNAPGVPVVYDNLYRHSNRYIMVCEYYNPSPMSVSYRGHTERLFKRDFAGELIERYGLSLVNYSFAYRRDNYLRYQDDVTWFLLQKK